MEIKLKKNIMRATVVEGSWYSRIHNTTRRKYIAGSSFSDCKSYMESNFSPMSKPEYINYSIMGDIDIIDVGFTGDEAIRRYFNISSDELLVFTESLREIWWRNFSR